MYIFTYIEQRTSIEVIIMIVFLFSSNWNIEINKVTLVVSQDEIEIF